MEGRLRGEGEEFIWNKLGLDVCLNWHLGYLHLELGVISLWLVFKSRTSDEILP